MDPAEQYAPNPTVIERLSLNFLRGRADRREPHIHRWSKAEMFQIEKTERWTIGFAALAGTMSGAILGSTEVVLNSWLLENADATAWHPLLIYWSVYIGLTLIVSGAEVVYLYWNVLRSVARVSAIAGLRLSSADIEEVIARGLSRAALDLPNPKTPVYGIDPYSRVPRWKLLVYAVLYRIKVGATSFLLRVLLRRILARAALRTFIPLVAIPVYATWNGVITRWIMRESRIRAAGPLVVQELGGWISNKRAHLDEESRRLILQVVGEAIIWSADAHPNFVILVTRLCRELDISPHSVHLDWETDRMRLTNLDRCAQDILLSSLAVTAMIDGRFRKAEKEFLKEAHILCGRTFRAKGLEALRREFINGQGLSLTHMKAVGALPEDQFEESLAAHGRLPRSHSAD